MSSAALATDDDAIEISPRDGALPAYVQAQHAVVSLEAECLLTRLPDDGVQRIRLADTSELALFGNIQLTTQALHELMRRGIPVSWHSASGWFLGHSMPIASPVDLRRHQFRAAAEPAMALAIAGALVEAKIANCRTLLKRNRAPAFRLVDPARRLKWLAAKAAGARDLAALQGMEGAAAAFWFPEFGGLLAPPRVEDQAAFRFAERTRRPPADPVNALLSFTYALLARTWLVCLAGAGFDPLMGFLHQPRSGRPALALDMMEPFRPQIAESAVLHLVNHGEVGAGDFESVEGAIRLSPVARRAAIAAYEQRLERTLRHPVTGDHVTYRRAFAIQARLLAHFLAGRRADFPQILAR